MANGKLVTKGLKDDFVGDVGLFGHEVSPNISELKITLNSQLTYISNALKNYKNSTRCDQYETLVELLKINTEFIKKIRNYNMCQRKKLDNLTARADTLKIPDKGISSCKTDIYTSNIWITKSVKMNLELCKIMSSHQKNLHIFKILSDQNIATLQNGRFLYDGEYISRHVSSIEYRNLIQKYSDIWYELIKESVVTSETIYNALGLDGVNSMKMHLKHFVKEEFSQNFNSKKKYSQKEMNGFATLCSIINPSLLPSCGIFYEEGCSFLSGKLRKNMICCTNSEIIR